jgi:RNA methyltransferase, TrmH family
MADQIASLQNPRVKQVVRLRERRERERAGLMLLEGGEELALALKGGARPRTLFICPTLVSRSQAGLLRQAASAADEVIEVSAPVFEKMAYRDNPDGWLALLPAMRRGLHDLPASSKPLLVLAEAVEKPGNLGALLRCADAAGVTGLIVCDTATDINNPNVVRSSRGTLFTVPVAEASLTETLSWLRARQIAIVAATPQAATNYTAADLTGPLVVAVGTEHEGLSPALIAEADVAVRIPMLGQVNSLNVATAAALVLYEAVRQRGANRA